MATKKYGKRGIVFKRCGCRQGDWAACDHSWHFDLMYRGRQYAYSLTTLAQARGDTVPRTPLFAAAYGEQLRAEIRAGTFRVIPPEPEPVAPVVTEVEDVKDSPQRTRRHNRSALEVAAALRARGCRVWLTGWPDLLVMKPLADGGLSIFGVEVKFGKDDMRTAQREVQEVLWRQGLPVFEVRDSITDRLVDRIIDEHESQGGVSKLLLAHRLYEIVESLQTGTIEACLFAKPRKLSFGPCGQCGSTVVVDRA